MGKDLAKLVFTLTDGFQNNIAPIHSSANFDILILEYLLATRCNSRYQKFYPSFCHQ